MNREELRKAMVGPVVTVPTPFDDDGELDLGCMADATRFWVDNGLVTGRAVIKVAAAMGEGPMLREWEWPALLRTVVQNAGGKAAIVCGIQYKDAKRAIEDAKRAQDLGAIGLQIAPPIFNDPTQADLLRYYGAISDAIDIGIIVYQSWWYPHGDIHTETLEKMKEFEHVIAVKWSVPEGRPYEDMCRLVDTFNVFDNNGMAARCHQLGGRGYICDTAMAYPPFDLRLWDLLEAGRYEEAKQLYESVNVPLREFYTRLCEESGGQGRLNKGLMAAMGRPMGSSRLPTLPLSDAQMAELRDILRGFGWPVP